MLPYSATIDRHGAQPVAQPHDISQSACVVETFGWPAADGDARGVQERSWNHCTCPPGHPDRWWYIAVYHMLRNQTPLGFSIPLPMVPRTLPLMDWKLYARAAAGAGPASTSNLLTGSTRTFRPSSDRAPSKVRSPGSPNTTSSIVSRSPARTAAHPAHRVNSVPFA